MPDKPFPIGRIELPDDWEPDGIICARVPIPDDPQYFSMLIGLVDQLRNSAIFARDPTRTGAATVSRTWERALNSMPIIIINCEGDEMPTILRDDPADPCKVQQSIDGGGTWFHAFNKDCEDAVIITPTDEAAEAAGNFMFNLYLNVVNGLNDNPDQFDWTEWICDWLETMSVDIGDCVQFADDVKLAWDSLSGPEKTEMLDPCTYAPKFEEIQSCFDDAGVIDWLNCASDTLMEWLNTASNTLMADLSLYWATLMGEDDAQNAANYDAGGGGGAGFGGECSGVFECIDFRNTPGGFVRVGSYGQWIDGVGWKAQINGSDIWEARIRKSSGFPATTPGNIQVVYIPTGNGKLIELYVNGALVKSQSGGSAGWRQLNYTPTEAIESVEIYVSQNNLNSSLVIQSICITE